MPKRISKTDTNGVTVWKCKVCGEWLPATSFRQWRSRKGLSAACLKCKPRKGRSPRLKIVDGVELWRCSTCKEYLPIGMFGPDLKAANGHLCYCRNCETDRKHAMDAQKRETIIARRSLESTLRSAAEVILGRAVELGTFEIRDSCSLCESTADVQPWQYSFFQPMKVVCLCSKCREAASREEIRWIDLYDAGKLAPLEKYPEESEGESPCCL